MSILEGKAKINVKQAKVISKEMDVFYNPLMELNRTLSILLLNSVKNKDMQIALPLSGSGIRGIRFLKELKKGKIKSISLNDYDKKAISSIKKNLKLNNVKGIISNEDANLFLLKSKGFDYIDVDPFGTPNPYLDASIKRISRKGILAITATDTSALSGTFPNACKRKYWAIPLRNEIMHEIGIRILIRKCQLIASQFDKALTPILSYSKGHYMRIFLKCEKGKSKVDLILKKHGPFLNAGPMWLGKLWDTSLVKKMAKENNFLKTISEESKINTIGFYHIPSLNKKHKIKAAMKQEDIIKKIKKKNYQVSKTHFKENSLRSNIPEKELIKILKSKK